LKEVSLEVKTARRRVYFPQPGRGTYTVSIEHDGKENFADGKVPAAPANIRDVDLNAGTKNKSDGFPGSKVRASTLEASECLLPDSQRPVGGGQAKSQLRYERRPRWHRRRPDFDC